MLNGHNNLKQSLGVSEYDSEEIRNSEMGVSVRGSALGQSTYGESAVGQSVYGSALGQSVYGESTSGKSTYGVSERGSLQRSEYGVSERGSIRQSIAGSVYASSEIMDDEEYGSSTVVKSKQKENVISSSISGDDSIEGLAGASLKLPFNLLNLEPLQKIRISNMVYPFPNKGSGNMAKKESSGSSGPNVDTDTSTVKTESVY